MGLEYDAEGERLVDMDLFKGKVKIGWQGRAAKKEDRAAAGGRFRRTLREELLPETATILDALEAELEQAKGGLP